MDASQPKGFRSDLRIQKLALVLTLIIFLGFVCPLSLSSGTEELDGMVLHREDTIALARNRIALVKTIFSTTAYKDAFYVFYSKYGSTPVGEYITTDLNLLNRTIVDDWSWSKGLNTWFYSDTAQSLKLKLGETVTLIDEIDVDQGELFSHGERKYDVVILGFTEYVTEREYLNYKQFVASGGTLIIMNACNFLAQVNYSNGYLSLVKGHGWEFNGTHAWRSDYHRWYEENKNWVGGNYWRYWIGNHYDRILVNTTNPLSDFIRATLGENIPSSYRGHEENYVQNMTGTDIVGYWHFIDPSESPAYPVAAYVHKYGKGMVIHSGIMGSERMDSDRFLPVFLAASIRFGLTGEVSNWTYPEQLLSSDDPVESRIVLYEKHGKQTSGTLSGLLSCDVSFNVTKDVLRRCYRCSLHSVTGIMIRQADEDYQEPVEYIMKGQSVNDTCWRIDISSYFLMDGDYQLIINATWTGVQSSIVVSETIGVLTLSIQNDPVISALPWLVPLSAIICAAVILVIYTRFNRKNL